MPSTFWRRSRTPHAPVAGRPFAAPHPDVELGARRGRFAVSRPLLEGEILDVIDRPKPRVRNSQLQGYMCRRFRFPLGVLRRNVRPSA